MKMKPPDATTPAADPDSLDLDAEECRCHTCANDGHIESNRPRVDEAIDDIEEQAA